MKIATWNVNSIRARLEQLLAWLQSASPDVLAVQETKVPDADFPAAELEAAGYRACYSGQKSYNGVAVLSRSEAAVDLTALPGWDDPQRRVLGVRMDGLYLLDVYVPNGSAVGTDKYAYKLDWLAALAGCVGELLAREQRVLVLGDFNVAPADEDVHDPAAWEGKVLVSAPERAALRRLLDLGLSDCFRLFPQEADGFTWWDYRASGFRRNHGLRIDLLLASGALAAQCRECAVDRTPRGWTRPSDHAPVWARFAPD